MHIFLVSGVGCQSPLWWIDDSMLSTFCIPSCGIQWLHLLSSSPFVWVLPLLLSQCIFCLTISCFFHSYSSYSFCFHFSFLNFLPAVIFLTFVPLLQKRKTVKTLRGGRAANILFCSWVLWSWKGYLLWQAAAALLQLSFPWGTSWYNRGGVCCAVYTSQTDSSVRVRCHL